MKLNRGVIFVIIAPLVGIAILIYEFAHPPWSPMRIAGLVLIFPALALLTIARLQLGNSFSVSPQAKKLVTHGVYSRIRDPIYFFGTFVFAGLFLFLEMPWLLLLIVPVVILQITRARAEGRVLEEKFGDEYRRYKASTWF
ncbi:MAG TPA: isoprenylcysteine carboxylmethyltransferase family protein [Candidatus Acidoferrum sp.]|nr:isoprenylcysteine carboxylmethyltransferase family protein [Candidatus Acidoferrum sp.]